MPGRFVTHTHLTSQTIAPRRVDVWLPPGYDADTGGRYPVLYAHDGQNLFDPATAYIGVDWGLHTALETLLHQGQARPAILVGIWNTSRRVAEYLPRRPLQPAWRARLRVWMRLRTRIDSDNYLRFIVSELKPYMDGAYRTLPGPQDTFVLGSSMGGLISLYAVCEHPQVFGGVACVSTHWPILGDLSLPYLRETLPPAGRHKLYFDYGTGKGDELYAPYQAQVDALLREKGYAEGVNWQTLRFDGAEHSERAWRQRAHLPLAFLLGPQQGG